MKEDNLGEEMRAAGKAKPNMYIGQYSVEHDIQDRGNFLSMEVTKLIRAQRKERKK